MFEPLRSAVIRILDDALALRVKVSKELDHGLRVLGAAFLVGDVLKSEAFGQSWGGRRY